MALERDIVVVDNETVLYTSIIAFIRASQVIEPNERSSDTSVLQGNTFSTQIATFRSDRTI